MNSKTEKFSVILNLSTETAKLLEGARYTRKYEQTGFLGVFCSSIDWSNPHYIQIEAYEHTEPGVVRTDQQYQTLLLPSHTVVAVMQLHDDQLNPVGFLGGS